MEKEKLDLENVLKGFSDIYLETESEGFLTVSFPTDAFLQAQVGWILDHLGNWGEELAQNYKVTCLQKNVVFGSLEHNKFAVVIKLSLPGRINVESIPDPDLRKKLINETLKHLALRIVKENPLPFEASSGKIPVPINSEVSYTIRDSDGSFLNAISEEHLEIFRSKKFQTALESEIVNAGGKLTHFSIDEKNKSQKTYYVRLKIKRSYEAFFNILNPDPVNKAVFKVLRRFFVQSGIFNFSRSVYYSCMVDVGK